MDYPTDRKYTQTHEWVLIDDNNATVGITDYAQSELGDIVFVNLPEPGDEVIQGEAFADVESVKAVSELFSPVSGTVVEINELLLDEPDRINREPHETWFITVNPITETGVTMDAADYVELCE